MDVSLVDHETLPPDYEIEVVRPNFYELKALIAIAERYGVEFGIAYESQEVSLR